jgi:hypothetical protein
LPIGTTENHDEAVLLVSALYALDGDLPRARERLAALGFEEPGDTVAKLALRHAVEGSGGLATDLATLAVALGHQPDELQAYVATATATRTRPPTPTPTSTPEPTVTPTTIPSAIPTIPPTPTPVPTRRPVTRQSASPTPLPPPATPLPRDWWDHRVDLLEPPVKLVEASASPGERYWRLVRLEWWKPGEGGNTMLYITTLREDGQPKWGQELIIENGGHTVLYTTPKPGEPHGQNYPMANTLNSYQVFVGGDLPSDLVTGLGLGEYLGGLDHTTFVLVFQLTRK